MGIHDLAKKNTTKPVWNGTSPFSKGAWAVAPDDPSDDEPDAPDDEPEEPLVPQGMPLDADPHPSAEALAEEKEKLNKASLEKVPQNALKNDMAKVGLGLETDDVPHHLQYLADQGDKESVELQKQLMRVKIELHKRKLAMDPTQYGLPDLNSLQDASREEQEKGIREVCKHLVIIPNGPPRPIKLIPVQVEFLVDLFFGHHRYAILWKPRGGGGSLVIAVLMWLLAVYKRKSCLDLAGGLDQARAVYAYTKGFWEGLPTLKKALLTDAPMKNETLLKSGASIKCVPASDRQVKGKHCPVLILDEACQKQAGIDAVFMDAMQGVFSEPNPIIVMNSTFYYPQGMFQEYWDGAEEKGFKKYKWTCFDAMARCERTDCFTGCPLSWQENVLDAAGKPIRDGKGEFVMQWRGCCGTAHETNGFQSFEAVVETKRVNQGSNVFEVQHCGHRPAWMDTIYPGKAIDSCLVESLSLDLSRCFFAAGIDWGLVGQTAVILLALDPKYEFEEGKPLGKVAVVEAEFMTGKLTSEVANLLQAWIAEYGAQMPIFPDSSHPFNNLELERGGFDVYPVVFSKWKEFGIGNVRKYLVNSRLEIQKTHQLLIAQLRRYQRLPSGKINKRVAGGDHGPDALMAGLQCWPFLEWFGAKVDMEEDNDQVLVI